jgi:peptidoglycan/LPS O-acetylase OafA/YrhL
MILEYLPLFTVGILLNEIRSQRGSLSCNGLGIVASLAVFHYVDRFNHNPLASAVLCVLLVFSAYGKVPFLRFRPLVFISTISYALYLMHNNLGCVFIYHVNRAGLPPWLAMISGIVFVIVVSAMVTYWLEMPLNTWLRNRWTFLRKRVAGNRTESVPASTS